MKIRKEWHKRKNLVCKVFIGFCCFFLLILLPFIMSKINLQNKAETTINIEYPSQTIDFTLAKILKPVLKELNIFANKPDFYNSINLISSTHWNTIKAKELIESIAKKPQLLKIKLSSLVKDKNDSFFSHKTLYLSPQLFAQGFDNRQVVTDNFLQAVGHYLDSQLSETDSPGDEGAIFAALVENRDLTSNELLNWKTKDDNFSVNLPKQTISAEATYSNILSISFPTSRVPWEWPFDPQSIWNLPIGSNAIYIPANIQSGEWTSADVELLFSVSESEPLTRLYAPGSWTHRCSGTNSPTGNPHDEMYIRFPEDQIVPDATPGYTPNNATAILQPDGETIISLEPLARCTAGDPVYGYYFGEENIYGLGITGGHGGSGLSTLGGSIRLGELVNDEPIRHALKVNLWGQLYLNYNSQDATPGYRWPAYKADSAAPWSYKGTNSQLEMGAMLALSPDVTPQSLGITTVPALKMFYALQDYGAYVVDDTGWNVTAFNLQEGVKEEFKQTYDYDFETSDTNSQWFKEYYTLVKNLSIVTNNSENSIGGGGERRVPLAPAFDSTANPPP
jgi:hypothetical protein